MLLPMLSILLLGGSDDWNGWRGSRGDGTAEGTPPVEWSETKNLRWKAPVPGRGISSPIVWGEQVLVTAAVPTGKKLAATTPEGPELEEQEFLVLAFERATGKERWRRRVHQAMPHQSTHPDATYATPTPTTDGTRVYASFGSFGVYALTPTGELAWQTDLGDLLIDNEFGEGSSPLLCGDSLVMLWDHEGDSFLVALDVASGKERWRTPRPKGTSWTTPILVHAADGAQIVVGGVRTIAYDPESGRELWSFGEAGRGGGGLMSTPVAFDELVLVALEGRSGGQMRALVAMPAGEPGEALWAKNAGVPGIPSLLGHEHKLYFLKGNSGQLTVMDPASGEIEYGPERLQGVSDVYASPLVAGGRLYVAGRDGTVEVLALAPEVSTLAVNTLEDGFDASPAAAGDALFLRGKSYLYCLAEGAAK